MTWCVYFTEADVQCSICIRIFRVVLLLCTVHETSFYQQLWLSTHRLAFIYRVWISHRRRTIASNLEWGECWSHWFLGQKWTFSCVWPHRHGHHEWTGLWRNKIIVIINFQEWNGGAILPFAAVCESCANSVSKQTVSNTKWYMKCFIYWTADLKSSKPWSSQLWTQFKQLRIETWKSQVFNGVWTRDLAIPLRRSNQLSYEATDVGSWSVASSNEPVKNGCEEIYELFHILNCRFEIK